MELFDREKNFKERLKFIKFWIKYIKKTPNKVWSRQQADFINSVLRSANQELETYSRIKNKVIKAYSKNH